MVPVALAAAVAAALSGAEFGDARWMWPCELGVVTNTTVEYRQRFVSPNARSARLAIAADTVYRAELNGRMVYSGRFPDVPPQRYYDVLPLDGVVPGTNELKVALYVQGVDSFQTLPGDPGLMFAVFGDGIRVESGTNAEWRLSARDRREGVPMVTGQLGFSFEYDAACPEADWRTLGSADAVRGADAFRLEPRPVPRVETLPEVSSRVIAQGRLDGSSPPAEVAAGMDATAMTPVAARKFFTADGKSVCPEFFPDGFYVLVDLGREEAGHLSLDVDTDAGAIIDIGHAEHFENGRIRTKIGARNFAGRYRARGGRQRYFRWTQRMAGRYIQLHVRGVRTHFALHGLSLRPAELPLVERPMPKGLSDVQRKIWETSVRTLRLCQHEHYEDCPWREQALYANDARNQMLCGYYAFDGSNRMPELALRLLARGLGDDNWLELCMPARIGITIPSFTFCWVMAVRDHLRHRQDPEFTRTLMPTVKRVLEARIAAVRDGLLPCPEGPRYWQFYEWSRDLDGSLDGTGAVKAGEIRYESPLNLFFVLALEAGAECAAATGDADSAARWRKAAEWLRGTIRAKFWNVARGQVETRLGSDLRAGELVQSLALLAGTVPDGARAQVVQKLMKPSDWTAVTLSQTIYKYEALIAAGGAAVASVVRTMDAEWAKMLDAGATSFWEVNEGWKAFDGAGSLCHGWSAVPVYIYGAYPELLRGTGASEIVCTSYPKDALDKSLSIRKALEYVERAVICREGDKEELRPQVIRLLGALDLQVLGQPEEFPGTVADWKRFGPYHDLVWKLPDWMTAGLSGNVQKEFSLEANAAVARLYALAGELYDLPAYRARGLRNAAWVRRQNGGEDVVFRDEAGLPEKVRDYDRLMRACRADLRQTIRRGGEEGRPFWNVCSLVFAYPPAFDFKEVENARKYVFCVVDDAQCRHVFEADGPKAALTPVWEMIPAGLTTVSCRAVAGDGRDLGLAGERKFWRQATFDPVEYAPAKRTYSEAIDRTLDYLFAWPDVAYLERHGEPDVALGNNFVSYPSKMLSSVIGVMVQIARKYPARRVRALKVARLAADYLLATAERDGMPLAGFTQTYCGKGQLSGTYAGQHMLVYPARAGRAFLELHSVTQDERYLQAAVRIGRKYLELQGADGTWFLKLTAKDASPVSPNRLLPTSVLPFLEDLYAATRDESYRLAADRAFVSIDKGPLVDWNWEGQFEDVEPVKKRYENLTKHMACDTALYLLRRFPGDARRRAQAREILRFAEDQFVFWRKPCRADGRGFWVPVYPFYAWKCPSVLEQYKCYSPIDASVSKLILTYLALYRAEGSALDLAKARALGDSMVNIQDDNGRIRTYWIPEPGDNDPLAGAIRVPLGGDWYCCMASDVTALLGLDAER